MERINVDNKSRSFSVGDGNYLRRGFSNRHFRCGAGYRAIEVVSDGTILTAGRRDNNSETMVVRWTITGVPVWTWRNSNDLTRTMAVDETRGEVYFVMRNGDAFCLDLNTGETIWGPVNLGAITPRLIRHTEGKDHFYVSLNSNATPPLKISKIDGTDLGFTAIAGAQDYSIATYGNYVYFGWNGDTNNDQTIYRIDQDTDSIVNQSTILNNFGAMVVDDSGVYFNAGGVQKWPHDLDEYYKSYGGSGEGGGDEWWTTEHTIISDNGRIYRKSDGNSIRRIKSRHVTQPYIDGETYLTGDRSDGWRRRNLWTGDFINDYVGTDSPRAKISESGNFSVARTDEIRIYNRDGNNRTWRIYDEVVNTGAPYVGTETTGIGIVDGDLLFQSLVPGGRIVCYNRDGAKLWTYTPANDVPVDMVSDNNGGIYVGGLTGTVYHIDNTGTETFAVDQFDGPVMGLEYDGSSIYAGGWKNVKRLSAVDGSQVWNYTTENLVKDITVHTPSGNVYVGLDDVKVALVDGGNGQFIQNYDVPSNYDDRDEGHDVNHANAIKWYDGFLFIGGSDGYVRKCTDELVCAWKYNENDNQRNITSLDVNKDAILTTGYNGTREYLNIPAFVADKKMRVRVFARIADRIFVNGERLNRLSRTDYIESREYEFYLSAGDVLAAYDDVSISGIELE
jgi:hypothetical protein